MPCSDGDGFGEAGQAAKVRGDMEGGVRVVGWGRVGVGVRVLWLLEEEAFCNLGNVGQGSWRRVHVGPPAQVICRRLCGLDGKAGLIDGSGLDKREEGRDPAGNIFLDAVEAGLFSGCAEGGDTQVPSGSWVMVRRARYLAQRWWKLRRRQRMGCISIHVSAPKRRTAWMVAL